MRKLLIIIFVLLLCSCSKSYKNSTCVIKSLDEDNDEVIQTFSITYADDVITEMIVYSKENIGDPEMAKQVEETYIESNKTLEDIEGISVEAKLIEETWIEVTMIINYESLSKEQLINSLGYTEEEAEEFLEPINAKEYIDSLISVGYQCN